jgi:hypothetical protein
VLSAFLTWSKNMREAFFENKDTKLDKKKDYSVAFKMGAVGGFISGLSLLFTGLLLSAVSYFGQISFHGLEVVMLGASFVFLMLGAHFLDLDEKEEQRKKKEKLNL